MAFYKFYSGTINAGNTSDTLSIAVDLGYQGRSGFIKNTGNNALTFSIKYKSTAEDFGDAITLDGGEIFNLDRDYQDSRSDANPFVELIKIDRSGSLDTSYKVFVQ